MFNPFSAFFAALDRLTAAVNGTAAIVEGANSQLAERLKGEPAPALTDETPRNGQRKAVAR